VEAWEQSLAAGDGEAAWNHFIARYRGLIIATIRRTLDTHEDLPDVLADVTHGLSADGLRALRKYIEHEGTKGRFSTWLVVVVRNRTIDWIRRQSGRRRITPPSWLTPLQQEIFRHVFVDRRSHAEAYELLVAERSGGLSFGAFLRELAETYRRIEQSTARGVLRYLAPPPRIDSQPPPDPAAAALISDARTRLAAALAELSEDVRLAVVLFVVDELPAADVARVVGWRSAKDVYNRVYRALEKLRPALERQGIRSGDS
jgi:RNA polymerase sigma factor (sigma-70 family)